MALIKKMFSETRLVNYVSFLYGIKKDDGL